MSGKRTEVQQSFSRIEGYNCFACAPREVNPSGLNLVFEPTDEGASTVFSFPKHFQSYPGFLHGGICSAVLDETMAYAGVFRFHALPFTRTLTLHFRMGVKAETEYRCVARILKAQEDSFEAQGAIQDARGRTLIGATGVFVLPTWSMAQRMMPGDGLETFREFFR